MYKGKIKKEGNKTKIVIEVDYSKVARGHQPRRSGAGKHIDKRTKRNRTRNSQTRKAISESSD